MIGPNGAGKTTLARRDHGHCCRRAARSGTPEHRVDGSTVEQRVAEGLVLVPEKRELFAAMRVADNLTLGAFARRRARPRLRCGDARRCLSRAFRACASGSDQLAGTLSGGERQMLALGRALMARPKLLMLDEPSLGLAPLIVREIFSIVAELRRAACRSCWSSRTRAPRCRSPTTATCSRPASCAMHGPSGELAADPRVAATYLGSRDATQV